MWIQPEKSIRRVQKPGRYMGGEWNSVIKDWTLTPMKMAFAFPDVYEVGMSHLGLQILYAIVNDRADALMERVFAPWPDMEEQLRENRLPLFSLESHRPLGDFQIIGFTLQYELSFTNILNMLDLSGIPVRSYERAKGGHPLIVAGGPCAFNPEPIADFIDVFAIGEGEDLINDLIDVCLAAQEKGESRDELLRRLAQVSGLYVPSLYTPIYDESGILKAVAPVDDSVPPTIPKRLATSFSADHVPTCMIVPAVEAVHDRAMLEVQRGCTRGCRFCQAGVIYRPVREREPQTLLDQAGELLGSTGWSEISLTSLSTADYSKVTMLTRELLQRHGASGVNVSLPSLRIDAFSVDLAKEVQRVRRSSLTFAPEAGTQRLRDVINKGVNEEDLMTAVKAAFEAGWQSVKLYFMIGLPTETDEDLQGIAELAKKVLYQGRQLVKNKGRLRVTVSISSFVPKTHTPFQWEPQNTMQELRRKQYLLKGLLKGNGLNFKWHDPEISFLEAVLARGDRKLSPVIETVWRNGARFDGWSEFFDLNKWLDAFKLIGIDPAAYAYRHYAYTDYLPWEHILTGVSKDYLIREHCLALAKVYTPDCREGICQGCGLCTELGTNPYLAGGATDAKISDKL